MVYLSIHGDNKLWSPGTSLVGGVEDIWIMTADVDLTPEPKMRPVVHEVPLAGREKTCIARRRGRRLCR
jgi:hypothetical protein